MTTLYEVYAIKYGHLDGRPPDALIEGADPHESTLAISYYVWLCIGPDGPVLVDLGFSEKTGTKRGRQVIRTPMAGLQAMGVSVEEVKDIVITHLHYDHVGNFDAFPNAGFHLQDAEMAYTTGRDMTDERKRHFFEVDEVCAMVRHVYADRVIFHAGDEELFPGFSVHHLGGHTAGLQCVRVFTRRGWIVLASDAAHLYRHFQERLVFPNYHDAEGVLAGYDKVRDLADSPDHVIPGHDPKVMEIYPAASEGLAGIAVRLD